MCVRAYCVSFRTGGCAQSLSESVIEIGGQEKAAECASASFPFYGIVKLYEREQGQPTPPMLPYRLEEPKVRSSVTNRIDGERESSCM